MIPPIVWTLLQMIFTSAEPALKAFAVAELQKIVTADNGKHPVLDMLLTEAEKLVQAA